MTDQWSWWRAAVDGVFGETTPGEPKSGFYRHRRSAIAIWRDDDGVLRCTSTGLHQPSHDDEIDEAFSFACRYPIPHELYQQVEVGLGWPPEYLVDLRIKDITAGVAWTLGYARQRLTAKQKAKPL